MKLLMITGDRALASGKKGPFYYMLEEFSKYWERIDIICPHLRQPACRRGRGFGGQAQPHIQKFFNNVYVHSSNLPLIFQPWFILRKGAEIFKQQKFDLFTIHSYPPFYNDIGGLWLYKRLSSRTSRTSAAIQHQASQSFPYILEVMHITGYPKAGNFKEWFYKILTGLFVKKFAKNAKAIRVINQTQVSEFLVKSGINKEKIKYIPAFYIDFQVFKPESLASGGKNVDKKYDIVFSGRLVKNKGINLLLEATKKLKIQMPNVKLVITGSGPLENKIKKYIKNNHLENNIEFIGWVKGTEELAEIYNQSKLMVMLSFNEGGPRVTLEAMACKVPVLTSKVGIMLDIVENNVNGVFVNWKVEDIVNKIMLLLKDDNLRNKIAENGYSAVQQFERIKAIKNYALNCHRLISSKFDVRSSDSDN